MVARDDRRHCRAYTTEAESGLYDPTIGLHQELSWNRFAADGGDNTAINGERLVQTSIGVVAGEREVGSNVAQSEAEPDEDPEV